MRQTCFSEARVASPAAGSSERSACFSALSGASLHFEQRFISGAGGGGFVVSTLQLSQLLQLWPAYIFQKLGQRFVGRTAEWCVYLTGFTLIVTGHQNKSTVLSIQPVLPMQSLVTHSDFFRRSWHLQHIALGITLKCPSTVMHNPHAPLLHVHSCNQVKTGCFIDLLHLITQPGEVLGL